MKAAKITYYVATGLLSAMMVMAAGNYIFNNAEISQAFVNFGYPVYIIYPLAAAKLLGILTIWAGFSATLRNLAYAGFLYNFVLALVAHLAVGDGQFMGAVIALLLLGASYWGQTRRRLPAVESSPVVGEQSVSPA